MSELPELPTVRYGYVKNKCRVESNDGSEDYVYMLANRLLKSIVPFQIFNRLYAVTHLQKLSDYGFLWFKPFIFHAWFTFREQVFIAGQGGHGWQPGTEVVLYMRTPGYRYDFAQKKFIRSKGYLGLRWD